MAGPPGELRRARGCGRGARRRRGPGGTTGGHEDKGGDKETSHLLLQTANGRNGFGRSVDRRAPL